MSENKKHPNAEWIIAFAEGKQLQFFGGLSEEWTDFRGGRDASPEIGPWNSAPGIKWRIKPEQQWVRVAQFGNTRDQWYGTCCNSEMEQAFKSNKCFSHWLSDRLYYTPKEKA